MKIIHFNNPALPEILDENGIDLICNENMDITISDEDAERIPDIIKKFAPYGVFDYCIDYNVNTLEEFAELINSEDEWKQEFNEIIEQNGWVDETGEEWGVCSNDTERIIYGEDGQAVVISK